MSDSIRVKICCIGSVEEAMLAINYGASAVGLVSAMPSGPGVISEELIAEIVSVLPPGVSSFLLTSKQSSEEIIEQQKRTGVNTIQIVDRLIYGSYNDFKKALPAVSIFQVIHVKDEGSTKEAIEVAPKVDGLLLDSGNQALPVKQLGGTGRTHNWNISFNICRSVNVPVFLAGGLNYENVELAVKKVMPFGVDVCSGVRSNGRLDETKLSLFLGKIKNLQAT